MSLPFMDVNCLNCAVSTSSDNQLFSKFTVVDEIDSLKSMEQEIAVLDAILYIYGFSATNLASAFLDEARGDDYSFSCTTISETSDYIIKSGLYLCGNCVSVFKKVYVAGHQLKMLSNDEALLSKAIKKFSPPFIKIEVDSDDFRCKTEIPGSEHVLGSVDTISNSDNFSDSQFSTGVDGSEAENLFQAFNFDKDNDNDEYYENEVKPDAIDEKESLPSSSTALLMNGSDIISSPTRQRDIEKGLNKKTLTVSDSEKSGLQSPRKSDSRSSLLRNNSDSCVALSSRTRSATSPLKIDGSNSNFTVADLKHERLPTVTVKLVRIEEEKYWKSMQLIQRFTKMKKKKGWKKRKAALLKREQNLKLQKEASSDKNSDSEFIEEESGNEANDQSGNTDKDIKSASRSSNKNAKILKCSCGKAFSLLECLQKHEKTHEIQGPVICDTCGASFERYFLLYIHRNKEHSELPGILFECSKCGKKFTQRSKLKDHELRYGKNIEGCRLLHTKEVLEKIINCSCGKPYRALKSLRLHEKTHKSLEPVMCDVCGEKFAMSYQLYGHKSLKHSEMSHLLKKCDFCDAKFLQRENRDNHVMQHHSNSRPFTCEICGKSFASPKRLQKHSSEVHGNEGPDKERLKCTECGLTLKNNGSLRNHMRNMHRIEKTIMCHLCGKMTKTATNIRIHMKVHDPNRTLKSNAPK